MLGMPNVDALVEGFHKDMDGLNARLDRVCVLLEKLVALEEGND